MLMDAIIILQIQAIIHLLQVFFKDKKGKKKREENQIKNTPKLLTQFSNILGNVCGKDTIAY